MDNSYIKLCAEIAYNDVIMESVLYEEVLNEDASSIKERIKGLVDKFITFIKNLWNKFITFLRSKIKELKTKIEEIKKKREEKKAKQESTSLYNQLMEMVLTEAEESYNTICNKENIDMLHSYMNNAVNGFEKYAFNEIDINKTISLIKDKDLINKINDINDFAKYQFNKTLDKICEEIENKDYSSDLLLNNKKNTSISEINDSIDLADTYLNSCENLGKDFNKIIKSAEQTIYDYNNSEELSETALRIVQYHYKTVAKIASSAIVGLGAVVGGLVSCAIDGSRF